MGRTIYVKTDRYRYPLRAYEPSWGEIALGLAVYGTIVTALAFGFAKLDEYDRKEKIPSMQKKVFVQENTLEDKVE